MIKGTENILGHYILRLRCIGLYDTLDPEGGKEFGHFFFEVMAPIPMEQKGSTVTVNQIQHIPIKLDQEVINRLQQEDHQYSEVIKDMKKISKTDNGDFNLDPQGVQYKERKDHGKEFSELLVPRPLQKYVLYKSQTSFRHNDTTRLYQFLKRQYY